MVKFENLLGKFIKNSYSNVQLSKNYSKIFQQRIVLFGLGISFFILIFSISGQFTISLKIKNNYETFNQFDYFYYFYYSFLIFIPTIIIFTLKNYFMIKYFLVYLYLFRLIMAFLFFSIIVLFLLSLLFIIEDIQVSTIYIYYITAILLFIIYYFYYKRKWRKHILKDNYNRYKKEIFKSNFSEDFLINKFSLDLNEKEKEKPIFTKVAELISILMIRFGFTLPLIAAISGSAIVRYDGMIYFCVYLILFIIPYFMKLLSSQVVFYKFIKQIEKEEKLTIYNGRLKTLDNEDKCII